MIQLGLALAALAGAALVLRDRCGLATATVLFVNWAVLTLAYLMTGLSYDAGMSFVVDYTAAGVLFSLCRTRAQLIVIMLFGVQIVYHAYRMVFPPSAWGSYNGWWFLFYVVCAQAVICGGSILTGGIKARTRRRHAGAGAPSVSDLYHAMAENGRGDR